MRFRCFATALVPFVLYSGEKSGNGVSALSLTATANGYQDDLQIPELALLGQTASHSSAHAHAHAKAHSKAHANAHARVHAHSHAGAEADNEAESFAYAEAHAGVHGKAHVDTMAIA